ncbi:putative HTH-type transcriptional regulator YulB [Vallitalea longa]|uniref:HTH-type transcriptional regulator YulB n=1 Tax=Vallitalea longa TaxID=2936439 RepID=A0A9W5Y7G2_9FIRM|nr:DeoR/GlpR family DNA-binding transcription regulator [Vallitalea longa]GKX28177.1 putative HTH-type transcriptional regulator YulB [Vallitalea longa]
MLAIDRRKTILEIINKQESVKVVDLSQQFNVTLETIRRDLEKLENEGYIKRSYGGAVLNQSTNEDLSINIREATNKEGKNLIGKKVADLIQDGDTIMMDSSTTALCVAKYLTNKNITIITNALKIPMVLAGHSNIQVISTGGTLKSTSLSFVGHWAESAVEKYYVNKTIISCKAINLEHGIMEPHQLETEVKKRMIKTSEQVILAVDSSKFDRKSFIKAYNFDEIDTMVTDNDVSDKWMEILRDNNVEYIKVND